MRLTIRELKNIIIEASFERMKNEILFEVFGSFGGETGTDSIDAHKNRRFSSEDIHIKVEKLVGQAKKLKVIADKDPDPSKSGRYKALSDELSDELYDLAAEIGDRYHKTQDPNVIYDVYKEFGFDPTKV